MRPHGIPSDEATAAAATAAPLALALPRPRATRRSPNLAARWRRRVVSLALASGSPQRRSLAGMEEEDLGEQTRGATASAAGHGLGRVVLSIQSLQREAETEKLNELMQSSFFYHIFICLLHLRYSILL